MQIRTTARHCTLDDDIRALANLRLEKCQRFARDLREAHVIVTSEGFRYIAEITAQLTRRAVAVREEAHQPRLALERAADRLEEHLRRLHERRIDRKRPPRDGRPTPSAAVDDADDEGLGD